MKTGAEPRYHMFLAHSASDAETARKLYRALVPRYRVFLASESLLPGDHWDRSIAAAQRDSLLTVVLLSPSTEASLYAREEIASAIALTRDSGQAHRVVPVYLAPIPETDIPYGVRRLHAISRRGRGLKEIAGKLEDLLRRLGVDGAADEPALAAPATQGGAPAGGDDAGARREREARLMACLGAAIARSASVSLALVDVNHQTQINARFGKAAGDAVIDAVEGLLRDAVGATPCGRLGADSYFAVFETAGPEAAAVIERLCVAVREHDWSRLARDLYVTCSAGLAEWGTAEPLGALMARAGDAVGQSKRDGGNRVTIGPRFSPLGTGEVPDWHGLS